MGIDFGLDLFASAVQGFGEGMANKRKYDKEKKLEAEVDQERKYKKSRRKTLDARSDELYDQSQDDRAEEVAYKRFSRQQKDEDRTRRIGREDKLRGREDKEYGRILSKRKDKEDALTRFNIDNPDVAVDPKSPIAFDLMKSHEVAKRKGAWDDKAFSKKKKQAREMYQLEQELIRTSPPHFKKMYDLALSNLSSVTHNGMSASEIQDLVDNAATESERDKYLKLLTDLSDSDEYKSALNSYKGTLNEYKRSLEGKPTAKVEGLNNRVETLLQNNKQLTDQLHEERSKTKTVDVLGVNDLKQKSSPVIPEGKRVLPGSDESSVRGAIKKTVRKRKSKQDDLNKRIKEQMKFSGGWNYRGL